MSGAYANLDGLVRLSQRQGVDIRRPLLRVLTDLYVQEHHHTQQQEQQFVELTIRLLPDIDAPTRMSVAKKLIGYPGAPSAILKMLADVEPEVRALLDETHTEETSHSKPALDPVPLPAIETPMTLVANTIEENDPPRTAGEAFFRMSSAERTALLRSRELHATTTTKLLIPGHAVAAGRIEAAALRRSQEDIVRELRQSLGISNRTAWRIVQDATGEPILIAAKALNMPMESLISILLFINPIVGESVERVFSLAATYGRMAESAGVEIIESWREEAAARPQVKFQSVSAEDGAGDTRTGTHDRSRFAPADQTATKAVNE